MKIDGSQIVHLSSLMTGMHEVSLQFFLIINLQPSGQNNLVSLLVGRFYTVGNTQGPPPLPRTLDDYEYGPQFRIWMNLFRKIMHPISYPISLQISHGFPMHIDQILSFDSPIDYSEFYLLQDPGSNLCYLLMSPAPLL